MTSSGAGDPDLTALVRAAQQRPGDPQLLMRLGEGFAARNRLLEALEAFGRASALAPASPEPFKAAADVLRRMGRLDEALAHLDAALRRAPADAWAWNNRAANLSRLGRPEEALASYRRATELQPAYALAHFNCGAILMTLGHAKDALAAYDRAIRLQPRFPMAHNNRGIVLRSLGRVQEALASYDAALAADAGLAEAHNNRGQALADLGRYDEALASFDAALAIWPQFADAIGNKGFLLSRLGRADAAAEALGKAIELEPTRPRYYYHLGLAKPFQAGDPRIEQMRALASRKPELPIADRVELEFALAKALADVGETEASFEHLLAGNALKRTTIAYDEAASLRALESVREVFTETMMADANAPGDPSDLPVFIVGMPRSGSTLVEQILASHPKIFGAGERDDFSDLMASELAATGAGYPEGLPGLPSAAFARVGAAYVERLRRLSPTAERIVDKTLDSFRYLGVIRLVLPNARIIHVRRDPLDTCLSCFSQLFGGELPYAYDLAELGRYYLAYDQLMSHWRQVMPADAFLEVEYETLIADLPGQTRRMLAYCRLEWDPRCLDFHLTDRHVSTMSAGQVRRPLYSSSVGAARTYGNLLEPLRQTLAAGGQTDRA